MRENERKQRNLMAAVAECDIDSVRKSLYEEIARLNVELDLLKSEYATEKAGAFALTITEIKFFLSQLRKGKADDITYRKTLINVFVNAIYLYDDKLVIFFNSGDKPITIDDDLLCAVESNDGFVFDTLASTKKAKGHPSGCPFALLWSGADEKSAAIFSVFGLAEMTAVQAGKEKLTDFAARAANVHDSRRSTK